MNLLKFKFLIIILSFCFISNAQTGTLKGHVSDRKSSVRIANANVCIVGTDTTKRFKMNSDSMGVYCFKNIPVGKYNI